MRVGKLPRFKGDGIGPRTETCVNWGGPIAMVPCFHQGNVYIKMKLRVWRDQKSICLVGAETALNCAGRQTTPSQGRQYRAKNGDLRKLGWTYRHGTVFAPRQCLYQKKATGMESTEIYLPSQCRNRTYVCGPTNYPVSRVGSIGPRTKTRENWGGSIAMVWGRYRAENKNLHKSGW